MIDVWHVSTKASYVPSVLSLALHAFFQLILSQELYGSTPYCNQMMNERDFALRRATDTLNTALHEYGIFYKKTVIGERCLITEDHSLCIEFERVTRISEISLDSNPVHADAITLLLHRGTGKRECTKRPENGTISNQRHVKYLCSMEGDSSPGGWLANAIKITSVVPWSVNLTNLRTSGSLGWLFLAERKIEGCLPPGLYPGQTIKSAKSFYLPGETFKISCDDKFTMFDKKLGQRTCEQNGKWSKKPQLCQPERRFFEAKSLTVTPEIPVDGTSDVVYHGNFSEPLASITELVLILSQAGYNQSELVNNIHVHIFDAKVKLHKILIGPRINAENLPPKIDFRSQEPFACINCSVEVLISKYLWNFTLIEKMFIWAATRFQAGIEHQRMFNQCTPIDPYHGMPKDYKDYNLILNRSLNDMILKSPCREGFKFVGMKSTSDMLQCKEGFWKGSFPKCEVIRVKTPPNVRHASWKYVQDDAFHELQYTCEIGYRLTSKTLIIPGLDENHNTSYTVEATGKLAYKLEADAWIGVPAGCIADSGNLWLFYLISAIGIVTVIVIATVIIIRRRWSQNKNSSTDTPVAFCEMPDEAYVIPRDIKSPCSDNRCESHIYEDIVFK